MVPGARRASAKDPNQQQPGQMMENDTAYANAQFIPDGDSYPDRWAEAARAFRELNGGRIGLRYGPGERETYDLFEPEGEALGTVIFIHGGYWLRFDPGYFSHLSAGPLARGWAVAMPAYDLAPTKRIQEITGQVARAVDAIAAERSGPIVITGHSAGGHLAARMGNEDVALESRARIERIVPISPISDLGPLMKTTMNVDLQIDAVEALLESPARRPAPDCPVTVWVGEAERPAFLHQARMLSRLWCADSVIAPNRHHFDVIAPLADPDSDLTRTIIGD